MKKIKLLSALALLVIVPFLSPAAFGRQQDAEKKGDRIIYLIRHGQYDHADTQDEFVGRGLVPLGIAQARLLAARLRAMPVEFASLTSSTMTRARETAMVIKGEFPRLELKQSELICECTPPTWRQDIMAETKAAEAAACVKNIEQFFRESFIPAAAAGDRHELVVCHGNVIRYFVAKALQVDTMSWLQMSISNCSLTVIRVLPDGKMKLDSFGDYGHIPENMRTFTGGDDEAKELAIPSRHVPIGMDGVDPDKG
ncbi:MAG TPA: histidine phosphatase family protein [Candidatus Binatia bacterium]|nr:histidine phosphatase family protein [Candidatus Binatia bacterium]